MHAARTPNDEQHAGSCRPPPLTLMAAFKPLPPAWGDEPVLDPAEAAALIAALEEIPSPAFVIWADGRVALANDPGRAASELSPETVPSRLLASLGGRDDAFRVTRIPSSGGSSHYLAVERDGVVDPSAKVSAASARWGCTPRQAEVLGLLALGQANKTIARALGCAASTVEIHVTALLTKSGCESRCEIVSRVWSGANGHRPLTHVEDRRRGRAGASIGRSVGRSWPPPPVPRTLEASAEDSP
jgi:DNA-binding CsgD family transcriptional regulator